MRSRILEESGEVALGELAAQLPVLDAVKRATLVACGTAWHACLIGKFLFEELAGLPTEVDYGSEFRYRPTPLDADSLVLAVSQSGETADTLAALAGGKDKGASTLTICNVVDSSIARKSDMVVYYPCRTRDQCGFNQGVHDAVDRTLPFSHLSGTTPRRPGQRTKSKTHRRHRQPALISPRDIEEGQSD